MANVRFPLLSPIRFHDPSLEFDNETTFQNPDNRLSTAYDWENVNEVPYALPIPKQWPDGQPGIDIIINTDDTTLAETVYADLYDSDDAYYKSLYVDGWDSISDVEQWRIWLDGLSGTGIEDGYYTIKLFNSSDDELLYESEMLLIADWFIDCIPFEFWNFETDFGLVWAEGRRRFTSRIMAPIRLYDPEPQFEKEVYKNDPGVLTTLRTIAQRIFNFDSHPLPVHITELIQTGFSCSELYLDRIKINSDEAPEAELYEGTNLKYLTGKATFVDFNDKYIREIVETEQVDQSIDWALTDYVTGTITGNSIVVNDPVIADTRLGVRSDTITYADGDLLLVKIVISDQAGDSDLPQYDFAQEVVQFKEWGFHWLSFRMNTSIASSDTFELFHNQNQKAVYTAVVDVYKIV